MYTWVRVWSSLTLVQNAYVMHMYMDHVHSQSRHVSRVCQWAWPQNIRLCYYMGPHSKFAYNYMAVWVYMAAIYLRTCVLRYVKQSASDDVTSVSGSLSEWDLNCTTICVDIQPSHTAGKCVCVVFDAKYKITFYIYSFDIMVYIPAV